MASCVGKTHAIVSASHLRAERLQPGTLVGIDCAEYAWDRGRSLDIDPIALVGADGLPLP